jgi:UPF0716 protein FxsA
MIGMLLILVLLFVAIPITELYLIVQVAHSIGALDTLALLLLISIVGGWLVRHEGLGVLARLQQQVGNGRVPTNELIDGAILLLAGALMLTPGFLTDIVGLLLLVPPVRIALRRLVVRRYRRRMAEGRVSGRHAGRGRQGWHGVVVDVERVDGSPGPAPPWHELEP